MHGCQQPTSTHPAASPTSLPRDSQGLGVFSSHSTRGPNPWTDAPMWRITPTFIHPASSPTPHGSIAICRVSSPRTRGGTTRRVLTSRATPHQTPHITRVRWRVRYPHAARSTASSTASPDALPASGGTYLVCVACHCYTSTVVYGSQRGVQVAESGWLRASRVTDCARATVVKRKTRNNGNTHHQPVVLRVQPLLKCAPSFAPNP
jgi:hypothetical protein